ncbi:DUF2461 domain-containing protein, partial [Bacteroidota bacterium]
NKSSYLASKEEFEKIVAFLIKEIAKFDSGVASLQAKNCVFRIYRDVRFSKDKSPYKINFGAAFNKGGKKNPVGTYYIHIEPGNSFVGGGMWMPPGDVLKKVRSEILYNVEDFKKIIYNNKFKDTYGDLMDEKLKRPPVGFPADFPDIELLKYKSFVVGKSFDNKEILKNGFIESVPAIFKVLRPWIK